MAKVPDIRVSNTKRNQIARGADVLVYRERRKRAGAKIMLYMCEKLFSFCAVDLCKFPFYAVNCAAKRLREGLI